MKVQARAGLKVPKEAQPGKFIDGGPEGGDLTAREVVEVPDTPYYQKQIADGDLTELIQAKDDASASPEGSNPAPAKALKGAKNG